MAVRVWSSYAGGTLEQNLSSYVEGTIKKEPAEERLDMMVGMMGRLIETLVEDRRLRLSDVEDILMVYDNLREPD